MEKIKNADDFEIGFNCMVRLYMRRFEEEILVDMIKVCDEYIKWMDHRTIVCALRDLIREYPFGWNEEPVPGNQMERFENLIKVLVKQGLSTERKVSHHRDEYAMIRSFSDLIGVSGSFWGKEKNLDDNGFCQWVLDNALNEIVEIKEIQDDVLPLKKKFVPMFYKVCNYMIYYSYERHTYMPSTCRDFVKANMDIMSDDALQDIVNYLKKENANIPQDERAIDKIDSDNWIEMQEDLEAELLIRQMFYKAQEKAENVIK